MRLILPAIFAIFLPFAPSVAQSDPQVTLETPAEPIAFGCRFYATEAKDPATPRKNSEFVLSHQIDERGDANFQVRDPDNLLGGEEVRHIKIGNNSDATGGEMWIAHANIPPEGTDLMFTVFPSRQVTEGEYEVRGASIGRPLPGELSMGDCFVFRGERAVQVADQISAKGETK